MSERKYTQEILAALRYGQTGINELAREIRAPVASVSDELTRLASEGRVREYIPQPRRSKGYGATFRVKGASGYNTPHKRLWVLA